MMFIDTEQMYKQIWVNIFFLTIFNVKDYAMQDGQPSGQLDS